MSTNLITGYQDVRTLPVKRGDIVTIRKGTMVYSCRTREAKPAGRTYKVKVNHLLCGVDAWVNSVARPPSIVWAGTGGYWHSVDINEVI